MLNIDSGQLSHIAVSRYEEHIWLLQQQNPDRVLKQFSAWQLHDDVNISMMVRAIQSVIEAIPDLSVRYELNDDGELYKTRVASWQSCLEFSHASSHSDMIKKILTVQASTWIPEQHSPFNVLIIQKNDKVILSLILHEILAQTCHENEILDMLIHAYAGHFVKHLPLKRVSLLPFDGKATSLVSWLCCRNDENATIHTSFGEATYLSKDRLALRWKTRLNINELETSLPRDRLSHCVPAIISARFAQFIALLGGQEQITLCLLQPDGFRHLAIECDMAETQITKSIMDKLQAPPDQDNFLAGASVTKRDESSVYVRLLSRPNDLVEQQNLLSQSILLPTYEMRPDFELAMAYEGTEEIDLILTTGQSVSSHAGEFLMSRFVSFLKNTENAITGLAAKPLSGIDVHATHDASNKAISVGTDEIATIILSEFREALAMTDMALEDDFFDCGGHSLLATRIIGKLLGTHGLEVHFGDFFSHPSAAALASRAIRTHQNKGSVSSTQNDHLTAPLALTQISLWNAYSAYEFSSIFNLPFALDFIDEVDETILEHVFADLIERHSSLRTLFYVQNGEICQQVVAMSDMSDYKWFWPSHESQGVHLDNEAAYKFDLSRELPIRIRLLHNPETGRQILSLLVHHMVIDEWSLNVLMDELSQAYLSRSSGMAPIWKKPVLSFHQFARQQQANGFNQKHLDYWTNMLRDATRGLELTLSDNQKTTIAAHESSSKASWIEYKPKPEVTHRLYSFARQNNASLFSIVYAAIALSLHKLGNLKDIVIGTSASGRTEPDTYETVGYFTTMVAHRLQFYPEKSVGVLIEDTRDTINNSMPYADVPLDLIQQSLGMTPEEGLIFDVYIQIHANNALNGVLKTLPGNDIRYRQIDPDKKESMFGLQFEIMEDVIDGERIMRLVITYRADRYPEEHVQRIRETIDKVFAFFTTPEASSLPLAQVPV
ncbi:Nonribosomal peptide synthetase VibF [Xenorhabdus bovienii str. oregonense]|uniref:Nonribosomal peptide synthetase VibF n=1 Tax=Xenorhabdus bovienii str. oregonense TaxID=1398202 RepID=A0A077PC25_XENBV|nr:condensation domain-containing protein [Xenorhabdus bovienii]CDH07206.1 Nonribosomal peptide synthetase VibF [Xenorhabdus bovienii str. oregonense]